MLNCRITIPVIVLISTALVLADIPRADWFSLASLSLACGVAALSLMAMSAVLGGRVKLIESMFGGLDRVYIAHKWLAIWALAFAAIHFSFKADLEGWDTASILTLPAFYTRLVRQLSLLALVFILLLALNRKIPYHRWRWWHKLSGPLFLIVILHWLSFRSPIELTSPAGLWLATWSALGVVAAAYKLLLYPFVSKHAEYRVVKTSPGAQALHLELEPVKDEIDFKPGQFGFISLKEDGLREPHPFTIASSARGRVHFLIRDLGDYTHRLVKETRVGMHANLYAPFGRFRRPAQGKKQIWIAGGVGISPFVAWLTDEQGPANAGATLFYFFTPGREFPSAQRVRELATAAGVELVVVARGPASEDFGQRFESLVREAGAANVEIAFCGPKGLLEHVRTRMRQLGIAQASLQYEHFEFR